MKFFFIIQSSKWKSVEVEVEVGKKSTYVAQNAQREDCHGVKALLDFSMISIQVGAYGCHFYVARVFSNCAVVQCSMEFVQSYYHTNSRLEAVINFQSIPALREFYWLPMRADVDYNK